MLLHMLNHMEHQIHMLTHQYPGQSLGGRMTHAAAATSNDIKMLQTLSRVMEEAGVCECL
jgi:hypothetical protein